MRILFLSTWFPVPQDNGSKIRVYHLLHSLAQMHAVTLVSFAFDTAQSEQAADLRDWCSAVHVVPMNPFEANRASTLRAFLSPDPVVSRPIRAMSQEAAKVFRAQTFDAVIASTEMMAAYALQASPTAVRILEEHNSLTRWMGERYTAQTDSIQRVRCRASWEKTRHYEARLFQKFDLVTMVSEQDRAVCLRDLPGFLGPVEVVPNGVDCTHNCTALANPCSGALVYNGSLTYSANYDAVQWFLAEIYPRVTMQMPNVSFTITGSIKGVDTSTLALNHSVTLTGHVDDVRVPVAKAEVCVVPIREGGGTRLKILEAMALGTPVVATRKAAEGLNVIDGEHLLLADDPETFAQRIMELLRDWNLRYRLAAKARRLVEMQYDWQPIGAAFVSLVEETVDRHA